MSEDKITNSSENKIGGVNDYEDDIPFVFKDQRKIKEAKPKNPKIIKILVCFIIGFIAVSGLALYMHEVWALENPELEYDRNIWLGNGDKRFFISYFNTEGYNPIQMYDCSKNGKVILGTLLRQAVGDERAWHFTYEPERYNVSNTTETQIYKSLVDYCRDNARVPTISSGTIDLT